MIKLPSLLLKPLTTLTILTTFTTFTTLTTLTTFSQEYRYNYCFFTNSPMPGDWYFSMSAAKEGSSVKNSSGKLPVNDQVFHSPGNSLELFCESEPGGNWNVLLLHSGKRGMDFFKKSDALSIWIYNNSENTSENEVPYIQVMQYDSSLSSAFPLPLTPFRIWQQVIIPFDSLGIKRSSRAETFPGLYLSQNPASSGSIELYLDDIELITTGAASAVVQLPEITETKGYARHVDIKWNEVTDPNVRLVKIYRQAEDTGPVPVGVQQPYINRYADFTGESGKKYSYTITFLDAGYHETGPSPAAKAETRALSDDELLTMVQEACFRYYWEGAEPNSGMARENIPGRRNMIATGASGFGIMALLVGTERKFITRNESIERFLKILNFLEKADRFHGAYGHFMNGTTGEVVPFFGQRDNGADLVESAFLLQGLLAARQYFDGKTADEQMIRDKITAIWEGLDWSWFRKEPDSRFLFWHWSPDRGWVINHRLIGWNETMVVYLLAIASPTHPVPGSMYFTGFASREPLAMKYRYDWGGSMDGALYINGNHYSGIKLDVGVNNGGPLFFTHYSYMGYDPHFITDQYTNYFNNNTSIAKINYNYCVSNPKRYKGYGENAWGLTACDGPAGYSADEPIPSRDFGKLAPTGAIASFPYTPVESMKALKNYYLNLGHFLWGEYGFKDAFNLTDNWCSEIYMGLNQAPMTVMIENYRTGLVWKLFMQDPEIREGLKRLSVLKSE
ncbi:MAG TPA: glucoamylase family protein [Bacteroidales bacterium]|nr:glucoamylase family protein [Bacteroidales bacterium]HOX78852.1 glucoamylase family protein [Bacteroidales bacterium]HPI85241.1 glucoamylase family protein [Bacteroidales bacterium]HPM91598.1 glucoamylase family protein [Bacteroidales bacterium]